MKKEELDDTEATSKIRQHPFEVRKMILTLLALGVAASLVVPTMLASTFKFRFKIPQLNFVRTMRQELRIVVCALAATALANPNVRWMQITHDGTSVNGKDLVTFGVRCVRIVLSSTEATAALRARSIFHRKVIEPLRFLANDTQLGFNTYDMGKVYDPLIEFLRKAKDDGHFFMSATLNIFSDALNEREAAIYDQWEAKKMNQCGKTCDGTMKVNVFDLTTTALFAPDEPTPEDAEGTSEYELCVKLLQTLAEGFVDGALKCPLKDILTSENGYLSALQL
mmetsp:Transcript_33146/g.38941  ORF Transcript_33146/g.38941 Transcript_33146/m.38941 type:complete len:281 (+) Transcript_33146:253-1095(+)